MLQHCLLEGNLGEQTNKLCVCVAFWGLFAHFCSDGCRVTKVSSLLPPPKLISVAAVFHLGIGVTNPVTAVDHIEASYTKIVFSLWLSVLIDCGARCSCARGVTCQGFSHVACPRMVPTWSEWDGCVLAQCPILGVEKKVDHLLSTP